MAQRPRGIARVEVVDSDAEAPRVAADIVESKQPAVAVEGGVLDALGHDRRRRLLKAGDERAGAERVVGAVDRQRRHRPGERLGRGAPGIWHMWICACVRWRAWGLAGESFDLGRERRLRLLELGLERVGAERTRVAAELVPQLGQQRLAGRIDEQPADVVEELVADGARHRPVAGSRSLEAEDLLDPDPPGAAVAQAAQITRGIGEAVGMVDAQPVDHALLQQPQDQAVGRVEHLLELDANPGEVVDVEEATVAAADRVDVEEALAQLRIGPEAVGGIGRHVVGYDVEHDPHAGAVSRGRQLPEGRLAAEIVGEPRRVDDVVAVRRAGARLQRRAQVQVRDPEVAQIGDQLGGGREAELGGQLQPVGGAQLARSCGSLEHQQRVRRHRHLGVRLIARAAGLGVGIGGAQLERPARAHVLARQHELRDPRPRR